MIEFAEVRIGSGRVSPCMRCRGRSTGEPFGLAQVTQHIASARAAGFDSVALTGFEPFAHPALPQLISAAKAAGHVRIRLRTDAGALATSGNAEGVLGAGVCLLEVVMLGDPAVHDGLARRPGLAHAAERGAAAFRAAAEKSAAHVAVTGYVPLCEHTLGGAAGAVGALCAMGAVAVRIDASELVLDEPARALVGTALDTATVNGACGFVTGAEMPGLVTAGIGPWRDRIVS